jgi:purine-binding chemotaxis protein CheW
VLLFHVAGAVLALPVGCVEETLRPLAVEPLPGAPAPLLGTALVRGRRIPVVALAPCLRAEGGRITRWITVRAGLRRLALAVEGVAGVLPFEPAQLDALPSLFAQLEPAGRDALATHVPRLLARLRSGWALQTAVVP